MNVAAYITNFVTAAYAGIIFQEGYTECISKWKFRYIYYLAGLQVFSAMQRRYIILKYYSV